MDELWDSTKEQYYKEKEESNTSKSGLALASMAIFPFIMNEEKPEEEPEVQTEIVQDTGWVTSKVAVVLSISRPFWFIYVG